MHAFRVKGIPVPQPRPQFNRHTGAAYTPKPKRRKDGTMPPDRLKMWRDAMREQFRGAESVGESAVVISVWFSLMRPRDHYGQGKNAYKIKDSRVSLLPTGARTGDVDNLLKPVMDVLQEEGVLPNDSQVCQVTVKKEYVMPGESVGAMINVQRMY